MSYPFGRNAKIITVIVVAALVALSFSMVLLVKSMPQASAASSTGPSAATSGGVHALHDHH